MNPVREPGTRTGYINPALESPSQQPRQTAASVVDHVEHEVEILRLPAEGIGNVLAVEAVAVFREELDLVLAPRGCDLAQVREMLPSHAEDQIEVFEVVS